MPLKSESLARRALQAYQSGDPRLDSLASKLDQHMKVRKGAATTTDTPPSTRAAPVASPASQLVLGADVARALSTARDLTRQLESIATALGVL